MLDTMTRHLAAISDLRFRAPLRRILRPLCDRYSSQSLTSAGLVINAGGATFAKIGAVDFYAVANGSLVRLAAGTALPALTGINIAAGAFNVVCFFVDAAGAVTVAAGTPGATLGAVVFPEMSTGKALVGFLIITNATAFTGGTTALDAATTVFISPTGPFDPTVLVG